jgi:hypothetical protein
MTYTKIIFLVLVSAISAAAQTVMINGTISDVNGARISGVIVTLTSANNAA